MSAFEVFNASVNAWYGKNLTNNVKAWSEVD